MTETLVGVGALYEGESHLGEAKYIVERRAPELRGEFTRISGRIVGGTVDLRNLMARLDAPLFTLELQDGRRWDCRLVGTDGQLRPVGSHFYRMFDGVRVDDV